MSSIFVSYRRDDGIYASQLLHTHLQNIFGDENVFLDVITMKPGDVFPEELKNGVTNAKVVVAMIGNNWKGKDPHLNRMQQEEDWVRKELELALADKSKEIFPVFIEGATASAAFADLPDSLSALKSRNGISLRDKEFKQDLLNLIPLIAPFINLNDPLKDLPIDENSVKYSYPDSGPFKGLDFFKEEDAKLFFGRGNEIRMLYNNIKNRNIVMLYGPSGSGKSSLLFAGLKPRLDYQEWNTQYIRRDAGVNLANKLDELVAAPNDSLKQLVIIDQVEEIFTNPDEQLTPEFEAKQLFTIVKNATDKKFKILLSFRKEYLAEIESIFNGLKFEKIYLEPIRTKGVLEAIRGVTLNKEAKDIYDLKFADDTVSIAIAGAVLGEEESYVAPLLQMLLRKMWDKVERKKPRIFSKELLEEVKSNNLISLLNDQINAVKEKFPDEVDNGLVLDVLYFFTTPRGTSASRTKKEVLERYSNSDIIKIITALKYKYLLTEVDGEPDVGVEEDKIMSRLAHDSLAPLIRELFTQSTKPSQRASRLLDSKKQDIDKGEEVEFSKADLAIIENGLLWMRKLGDAELKVIEQSRIKISQHELELEEKNKQLEKALKEARAKALAATAREKLQTNPTLALRLAEAACKVTPIATKEAQSAILDIMRQKLPFYKRTFEGHSEAISSVAFSPDGNSVLTGSRDKTAKLWNINGTLKQTFEGHTDVVISVAFSPNGNSVLTGSWDKTTKLWNLDGTLKQVFEGHSGSVISVAFSPDGNFILIGSNDYTAKLWNIDGTLKQAFEGHSGSVGSVTFSPDGYFILTGSSDNTSKLWNLDGTLKQTFEGHTDVVNSVAFSPDGNSVLTGSRDGTANLWKLDGTLKQTFEGHLSVVDSIAFSPDGNSVITGSRDKTAKLWNLDGTLEQTFEFHSASVTSVRFSPDGNHLLTGSFDKTAKLWKLDAILKQTLRGHSGAVYSVAFSLDCDSVLTGSGDNTAKLWNLDGTVKQTLTEHSAAVYTVAFSPDYISVLTGSGDTTAKLWNLDGTLKQTFTGHSGEVYAVAFSPDNNSVLTGSRDTTAKLWNLDGTLKQTFGRNDETATFWVFHGTLKQTFEGHSSFVNSVAFSPDGNSVLTGSRDGTAKLWNLDGTLKQTFEGHSDFVNSVAFSPDGNFVLTGSQDRTAKLWNLDGTLKQTFEGHSDSVHSVGFSPDSNHVLTGSSDKTTKLWKLDGTLNQIFEGHSGGVTSVVFSPDGNSVFSGSRDKTAKLWQPYWVILDPENTAVPTPEQMKEYDIPEYIDKEWGKVW